ncbi:anti-sigma-D factor RsdA [Micromonospora avicenniae]|uniref:Anti-sigma-D factor RsdA to sigma factor binding region n=1 Tax=Micromonospora avicenniae TaxID=1198245 RepID=A0A1N6VB40_9ACTN|nr:anti-sigma-D factor RsdA [Micromonospora avicenniae]SIQ75074.1 Anti-sigma-D factor RsdA to sigma factor binding region [Micromonospora avicenniae]
MTGHLPPPQPEDPVLRDDRLLDALSRGGPPPADHPVDDPLPGLLGSWQSGVEARARQMEAVSAAAGPTAVSPPDETTPRAGTALPDSNPHLTATTSGGQVTVRRPPARMIGSRRRPAAGGGPSATGRRRRRGFAAVALALVGVPCGLWLGAAHAEPGGTLWPVTRLVHADRAESMQTRWEIGQALDRARRDLAEGRHDAARSQLERAAELLGRVDDDAAAARLRDEIEGLGRQLPAPTPAETVAPVPQSTESDEPSDQEAQPSSPASATAETGLATLGPEAPNLPAPADRTPRPADPAPREPVSTDHPSTTTGRTPRPADPAPPRPTAGKPEEPPTATSRTTRTPR